MWELLCEDARLFAAAAPVCGRCDPEYALSLTDVPVWVFHGGADSVVPVSQTMNMIDAIRRYGGEKFRFTLYPGLGHDCWTETYDNPELYQWLLSHRRPAEEEEEAFGEEDQ